MHKIWNVIIDLFIALTIMFLGVSIYYGLRTETVVKTISSKMTDDFLTEVNENGSLTLSGYEYYLERLSLTESLYDISFEHKYKVLEPEYRLRTLEEIIAAQNAAYQGPNDYYYKEVVTQKPVVSDPINTGNLNTETNESVLEKAVDTPADPNHVHTDSCYDGVKHTHSGNSSSGGGCYGDRVSGTCGSGLSGDGSYNNSSTSSCSQVNGGVSCTGTVTSYYVIEYYRCSNGHQTSSTAVSGWYCSSCSNSYEYRRSGSGPSSCSSSSSYYKLNCGKEQNLYYNGNTKVNSSCHLMVVSISPTHLLQTVYINDPLITTVRVTYADGSKSTQVSTTTFSTGTIGQSHIATLTYKYVLHGVQQTKTCSITVNIIPKNKGCVNGHTYNLKVDGSDPGCPYCRAWVRNLRVTHPATSTFTITIGTTLPDNGVKILVTYLDGRTETITSGYIDNLDTGYLGTKLVTIGYKGVTTTLMVTTIRARITCDICGFEYEIYPDGTNPGCPSCISKTPVFTGNTLEYEKIEYTEHILESLHENEIYSMNKNDVFTVNISNKSSNIARKLLGRFLPSLTDRWVHLRKSGKVKSY